MHAASMCLRCHKCAFLVSFGHAALAWASLATPPSNTEGNCYSEIRTMLPLVAQQWQTKPVTQQRPHKQAFGGSLTDLKHLRSMLAGSCLLLQYVEVTQDVDTWMLSLPMQNSVTALLLQDKPEATTWQCAIPEWDRIRPGQQCMLPFICCALLCPIWSSELHMHTDRTCISAACQAV